MGDNFTPLKQFPQSSPSIVGITAVKSRRHTNYENPVSKSTRKFESEEDSEPADPELSDDEIKPV